MNLRLTGYVGASGLELSSAAGVALQQADDGGVTLSSFDELLQRQLAWNTYSMKLERERINLEFMYKHMQLRDGKGAKAETR